MTCAYGLFSALVVLVDIVVVPAFDTSAIDFMIWLFAETRIAARVPLQRSSAFGLCNTLAVVDIVVAFALDTIAVHNVAVGKFAHALTAAINRPGGFTRQALAMYSVVGSVARPRTTGWTNLLI